MMGYAGAAFGMSAGITMLGVPGMVGMGAMIIGGNMALLVGGAMLISSVFKPSVPSTPSIDNIASGSTTYSWNSMGNANQEGGSVPVVYGTLRITPQIIGKYITVEGDIQYLHILLAIGEGPFNYINNLQLNDTDIALFSGITLENRLGLNTQSVVEDFINTWRDTSVGKTLSTDTTVWTTMVTSGNAVSSLNIGIVFPSGLYHVNDRGGFDNYSVQLAVEIQKVGDNTWTNLTNSIYNYDYEEIYVDKNPTKVWVNTLEDVCYWEADNIGPYDVYRRAFGSSTATYINQITNLPAGITTRAVWPGTSALYQHSDLLNSGIQLAWSKKISTTTSTYYTYTDSSATAIRKTIRASGLPEGQYNVRVRFYNTPSTGSRYGSSCVVEYLQETISDQFSYPNTGLLAVKIKATDQLSGGMPKITCIASRTTGQYGRLDNPAWAALDLLTNTRYGAGVPMDSSRIDFQSFQDWADYCTQENFTCNIILDQTVNLSQSMQLLGQLGRGAVMQYGSKFVAVTDKPNTLPVQGFLFSMGNIVQNSFSESFLPLKDRANVIEVTYWDADNNYQQTVLQVTQGNYDLVGQVNKVSLNLLGCVSKEQALRQAKYHLNQNRYLTVTASWDASIDAIYCKVGDIVNVAHDVPEWGASGRILGFTSANTVKLDRTDISITSDTDYYLQISNGNTDEQVYTKVLAINNGIVTTQDSFDLNAVAPEYSVYAIGPVNRHAKKMRIVSIVTKGDLTRTLTALEYNENVYADSINLPAPVYINNLKTRNLVVSDYIRYGTAGSIETVVQLNWYGASLSYKIYYKKSSDTTYTYAGTSRNSTFEINGLEDKVSYDFKVDNVMVTYTVVGKSGVPDVVTNLTGSESGNVFTLNWAYPYKPLDFKQFLIYHNDVLLDSTTAFTYTTALIYTTTSYSFQLAVEDMFGNISDKVSVLIPLTPVPSVTGLTGNITGGILNLTWTYLSKPTDFAYYNIYSMGNYIGNSTGESFSTNAMSYAIGTVQNFYVTVFDSSGNQSADMHIDIHITAGAISNVTYTYTDTAILLKWVNTAGSYLADHYTVSINGRTLQTATTECLIPVDWSGTLQASIVATDTAKNTYSATSGLTITNPATPVVIGTVNSTSGIDFTWTVTKGSLAIKEYKINYNGNTLVTKDAKYFVPIKVQGSYNLQVTAVDMAGNESAIGSKVITIGMPSITNITASTTSSLLNLVWGTTGGTFSVNNWKVEYAGTTSYVSQQTITINPYWVGDMTFTITPIDIAGNIGIPMQFTHTILVPKVPVVTSEIVGKDVVFNVVQAANTFAIAKMQVSYDSVVIDIGLDSASWTLPIFWKGTKSFNFVSIDTHGNRSTTSTKDIVISVSSITNVTAEVIDNNILLRWTSAEGTLPIDSYIISKGDTYGTAAAIGNRKGTFTTTFESESGEYTYWVTPVDTAGNLGSYYYVRATVSQPPDFVLNILWVSDWGSTTGSNYRVYGNDAALPINTSIAYKDHFTTYSWSTAQDQVTAGYPLWLTPSITTATYTEIFNYGTVLGNTNITLTDPLVSVSGSGTYTMSRTMYTSKDGTTYTAHPADVTMLFLADIQYVKVVYTFTTSDAKTLLTVGKYTLRLDSKIKNDAGSDTALSYNTTWSRTNSTYTVTSNAHGLVTGDNIIVTSDSTSHVPVNSKLTVTVVDVNTFTVTFTSSGNATGSGTYVRDVVECDFNVAFVDVTSITVTASGSAPIIALYDFVDIPNPTKFYVRLFDNNGNRIAGSFSWAARGY
jgi:predicted phage tail protein